MGRFYDPKKDTQGLDFGYGPTIKKGSELGSATQKRKQDKPKEESKDKELYVRREGAGKYSGIKFSELNNSNDTEPNFSNDWSINTGESSPVEYK